jgi:Flp pilus assembly protein TadD
MVALVAGCAGGLTHKRSDTYEARKGLTRKLIEGKAWQEAFAYADQLHREAPDDAEVLVLRGTDYRERGLPEDAEADLKEAIKLAPELAEAHDALGLTYDMTNRSEAAEPYHTRAVALARENPIYLNNLGYSLFLRHKHREAIEVYMRAVRLSPASRRIRNNLGFAYAASGDLPRAAREFALGAGPAQAKNNLGMAYERRGDLGNAFSVYVEALRLDPRCDAARANLVYVASKLGKDVPQDVAKAPSSETAGRSATP